MEFLKLNTILLESVHWKNWICGRAIYIFNTYDVSSFIITIFTFMIINSAIITVDIQIVLFCLTVKLSFWLK